MSIDMNTLISGGTVTVEDGLKAKEEYAPARKVVVSLNFSTPEGVDGNAILAYTSSVADKQVRILLNKAPAAPPVVQGDTAAEASATTKPAAPKKSAKAPAETGKTKADLAKEAGLPTESTQHKGTTAPLVDELDEAPAPAAEVKDELADLLGDTAPVPVTDAELGKAAQEKNGDMKGKAGWAPEKIRELVAKFVLVDGKPKPGAKLQDIPAAQRHDFLAQLKALK